MDGSIDPLCDFNVPRGVIVKVCTRWHLVNILSVSLAAFVAVPAVHSQSSTSLPLMPLPLHATQGEGQLKVDAGFTIALEGYKDARLESARKRFLSTLSRETGIPYHDEVTGGEATLTVKTGWHERRCAEPRRERVIPPGDYTDACAAYGAESAGRHAWACRHFCSSCRSPRMDSARL